MQDNNKLVAEFMGDTFYPEVQHWYDSHGSFIGDALKYHTSWDWLMPVVEKIENISGELILSTNLENTYPEVVEFIKQYNDEK